MAACYPYSEKTFGGWLSVKIDGSLVNVLSSEGKVLFEGLYSYSNGVLKFRDFTLYLDMDRKLIKDDRGEYLKSFKSVHLNGNLWLHAYKQNKR